MNSMPHKIQSHFCRYAALIFLLTSVSKIEAQQKFEYGITLGGMKYEGDLGGRYGTGLGAFNNRTSTSSFNATLYLGYRISEFVSIRVAGTYGGIQAADSLLSGDSPSILAKKTRNAHFKSIIAEGSLMAEIYPTVLFESNPYMVVGKIRPYLLAGIGVFHFDPKGLYQAPNGTEAWVNLQPLRTEGQGMPNHPDRKEYALIQQNLQLGFGIKYHISQRVGVSFELIGRKTPTDYLDDVSTKYIDNRDFYTFFGQTSPVARIAEQMANNPVYKNGGAPLLGWGAGGLRGSPKYNDYYYSSNIRLSYRFGFNRKAEGMNRIRSGAIDCPKPVF
jgi:hypothetical protein